MLRFYKNSPAKYEIDLLKDASIAVSKADNLYWKAVDFYHTSKTLGSDELRQAAYSMIDVRYQQYIEVRAVYAKLLKELNNEDR